MFSDIATIIKIPPKSQKVSIIKTDYVTSLKKVSIILCQVKAGETSEGTGKEETYF